MEATGELRLYDSVERSDALGMVQSSRWTRRASWLLALLLVAGPILLMLVPWRQNIPGSGRVIAYAPLERQQPIEAPVTGRVVDVWVTEGSQVKKGDPLIEISDIDPLLVQRLNQERDAILGKIAAVEAKVLAYEQQIINLESTRDLAVAAASFRVEAAKEKVRSAEQEVAAAKSALIAAEAQYERKQELIKDGIVSTRQLEVARRDYEVAQAKVTSTEASLKGAQNDQQSVEQNLEKTRAENNAKVDSGRAQLRTAEGELNETVQKRTQIEGDISAQESQKVLAPRDGTVFRLDIYEGGKIVKQGDLLLVLVPDTQDRAAELWVDGNDAPLINTGTHVRLQFEGWPAVQFAGWPSVAVGTFGGKVTLVDQTDDGRGRFRIVVQPENDLSDWPDAQYLRQGVRAKAWVLLNEVSLGYELWRQLNGFPPVISPTEPKSGVARKRVK